MRPSCGGGSLDIPHKHPKREDGPHRSRASGLRTAIRETAMADAAETVSAKVRKSGVAAVEAELEKVEAASVDEVRAAIAELQKLLDRAGASDMLTAAKERVADALQFAHAHFGIEA